MNVPAPLSQVILMVVAVILLIIVFDRIILPLLRTLT